MNKIFKKYSEIVIILIISFFGIGYIPHFSGILTIIMSSLIIFLPVSNIELIIQIITISLLILYIPSNIIFQTKFFVKNEINVLPKSIGILITFCSPVIVYSLPWIMTNIFVFSVLSYSSSRFEGKLNYKMKIWSILIRDLMSGVAAVIVLHALYAGWLISPYVIDYFKK